MRIVFIGANYLLAVVTASFSSAIGPHSQHESSYVLPSVRDAHRQNSVSNEPAHHQVVLPSVRDAPADWYKYLHVIDRILEGDELYNGEEIYGLRDTLVKSLQDQPQIGRLVRDSVVNGDDKTDLVKADFPRIPLVSPLQIEQAWDEYIGILNQIVETPWIEPSLRERRDALVFFLRSNLNDDIQSRIDNEVKPRDDTAKLITRGGPRGFVYHDFIN